MENDDFVLVDSHDVEQSDDDAPIVTPEDLEKIRLWLLPTEFDSEGSEYRKHLNAHVSGTGDWLFETEQYKNWYGAEDGIGALWIQGIPGSGKSVIAANLIQTLKNDHVPVLFFFSRRIIKSNSEPRFLVRDCLYQLLDHSIALQRRLKGLIEQHNVVGNVPFHEHWKALVFGLSTVPKAYLVFDALDELATEEDNFLQCLLDLGQQKPDSIKLIMTSRPLPHLQSALKSSFVANVRLSGQKVERDISTYITHRLASQQEKSLSPEDQSAIREVLCQKGHSLFLYARLMLDELLQRSTPVSAQLQCLPSSLEEMYLDLLYEHSSRSGASLRFQSLLLAWVTHASRPLRVTELAALINSTKDRGGLIESQDAKLMVQTSCGPLLEILDDETVQVIHHSFTEFLLDSNRSSAKESPGSQKWFPAFTPAEIHLTLTTSCVDYLNSGCFDSWSVEERSTNLDYEEYPSLGKQRQLMVRFHFLQYASQNLLYHAAKCDKLDMGLHHKLDELMQYGSHNFESWKDFWFAKEGKVIPDGSHPLHVAAQAGLTAYTVWLLGKEVDHDLVDSQKRTPTAYAAMYGHAETLAALLDQKASITISDWDGLQPIHYAAKGNHVKALRCLLDAGADPMLPKSHENHDWYECHPSTLGTTPMQLACEMGNADAVAELLQPLKTSLRSSIMPHWASATGQAKVLSKLFQYPDILANVNKKDRCGNAALYLAACVGDSATVRILLENGADVHSRSDDFDPCQADHAAEKNGLWRTPLQGWANFRRRGSQPPQYGSVEEWEKTCILLIEAKSDIEARDKKGRTVLFSWTEQFAYGRGDSDRSARFVSLLLKHGANPRATDNEGNTPLHMHLRWNQDPRIIGLFTKSGADINATRPGDLATPLIASAKVQCTGVKAYIENGADFNIQDADGNTALHHICRSWLFELKHVEEWLTVADPSIKNNKGETCLYNLRFGNGGKGRVQAIPLLMKKGLNIESKNRLGRTALLSFCEKAEPQFIVGLVRYGANARARDFQNKSCLHLAAQVQLSNHDNGPNDIRTTSDVIETLIKAGADINDVDFDGNTPFLDAVESSGHFTSLKIRLQLILKFGGLATATNHRGQTALHKVAALCNSDSSHYALRGVPERIDFLLQESLGLDLHARDNEGMMPIHIAALTSDTNVWKFVQAGAEIEAKADDLRTPLHFAANAAQCNAVGILCQWYKEKYCTVDQTDETARTALHYASLSGSSECVYYLLKAGADLNIKDHYGLTPLHVAAEHQIDTAKLRKQRKYEKIPYWKNVISGMHSLFPYMDTRKDSLFHKTKWNMSLAIRQEGEARLVQNVVRLLLSAGADTAVCDKSGQTPYDVAMFLNNEEMVEVLTPVQQSTDTHNSLAQQWYISRTSSAEEIVRSLNIEDIDAYTLLHTAICLRNEALLDALLKTGVDPKALGPDSLTPVHTIAHFGLTSMMKIIALHAKDLNVFSPPLLHVAASREQSNVQMIDLLLELGVKVSASYEEVDDERRRSTGAPVPSYAVAHILATGQQWWNTSALESLCKAGADLEMTDGNGNTALQCSLNGKRCGSWGPGFWRDETLEVLLRYGANVNALSPDNGATPLNAALESRRGRKVIQKLLNAGADITMGKVPAIFEAIESEEPEAAIAVLDAGADVNAVYLPEQPKKYGKGPKIETPILSAALSDGLSLRNREADRRSSREEIMTLLIQRGANPLLELQDGKTTVIHEIAYYHGLIAPILRGGVDLEIRDSQNRTPLLAACTPVEHSWRGTEDESTSCELILAGADIHAIDSDGSTPLHLAVKSGLFKTSTLLLENGASASAANEAGLSPLYYALCRDHRTQLKFAKALLAAGADPLITGCNGETPLHLLAPSLMRVSPSDGPESKEYIATSALNGQRDETDYFAELSSLHQLFVDKGWDRNCRDYLGNTPLFPYVKETKPRNDYCCVEPPAEKNVRKMFEEHDIFAVNDEGETLLHIIASRQEGYGAEDDGVWLFKELLARGLDPRKENKKRLSALDVAAACGKEGILALFAREE